MSEHQTLSVLVYDGQCAFCRSQMERIRRLDKRAAFEYLPNQDPSLLHRFPRLAEGDLQTGLRLITPDGRIHIGADAVYEVARRLPFWGHLSWLYRVPGFRPLAGWVYGGIAARRYRLAGKCDEGTCSPK